MKNVQTFHVLEEVPFHITGLGGTKKVHDWSPSFTEEEAHKPRKKKEWNNNASLEKQSSRAINLHMEKVNVCNEFVELFFRSNKNISSRRDG